MDEVVDVVVIGGGAAGLAAAIFCAERMGELGVSGSVAILDGAKRLGAKILVAGGGRCNVTHDVVGAGDYQGNRNVVRRVLRSFGVDETVGWFGSMGVELKREATGKLFPVSDRAQTVLDALVGRCGELGVAIRTGRRVERIERRGGADGGGEAGLFRVRHSLGELAARRVVVATGGRSLPKTGSDGFGYGLVRGLDHTVTETWAGLVPLVLDEGFFHAAVSGVSLAAEVSTYVGGKVVDKRAGDLLWTHFGVSGPVVMDASRFWVGERQRGGVADVRVNLLPDEGFEGVDGWLAEMGSSRGAVRVVRVLSERLPARLAEALMVHAGIGLDTTAGRLRKEDRRVLAHALTGLVLPVVKQRGWNYAEVTAGGVPLGEVDAKGMGSRRCEGLYLAGEILDCEGRIGGFNFQWAWATGRLAGRAAAESLDVEDGAGEDSA